MEEGRRARGAVAAALVAGLGACGNSSPPASAPRVGNVLAAVLAAADQARTPWRCAALDTPALAEQSFTTGDHPWQLGGHMLRRADSDDGDGVAIGVIADAANASPRTIAALGRLRGELDKAAPDVVLALGGMGSTQAELEATLGTIAERAPWPVVALPGDLEPAAEHAAALAALRRRGATIVDGRLARWIELPGVTIATLPGAGARERLVAGNEGCQWRDGDVAALSSELSAKPGVRVFASSEAPRTSMDGEPAGELALVPAQPIEVALVGPIAPNPSPARAGNRDGQRIALTPGTADATRRLPDAHVPSAGLLVVRAGTWSWRPLVAK